MYRGVPIVTAIAIILSLTACSGMRTEEILKSGSNVDAVRNQLGLPLQGILELPNGNKMWTFGSSSSGAMPMTTPSTGAIYSPYGMATYNTSTTTWMPVSFSCTVQIEATPGGYIQRWQWQGNNCP